MKLSHDSVRSTIDSLVTYVSSPTSEKVYPCRVTFSEDLFNFQTIDISVTEGHAPKMVMVSQNEITFEVVPSSDLTSVKFQIQGVASNSNRP